MPCFLLAQVDSPFGMLAGPQVAAQVEEPAQTLVPWKELGDIEAVAVDAVVDVVPAVAGGVAAAAVVAGAVVADAVVADAVVADAVGAGAGADVDAVVVEAAVSSVEDRWLMMVEETGPPDGVRTSRGPGAFVPPLNRMAG